MVNDDVLLPNGGKTIPIMFPNTFWETRSIRREFQVWPVFIDQLAQIPHPKKAICFRHKCLITAQFPADQLGQFLGHTRFYFQPDNTPASPPLNGAAEIAHQILGLFLNFNIAIANDAKSP